MNRAFFAAVLMASVLAAVTPERATGGTDTATGAEAWSTLRKPRPLPAADEKRIAAIVARMTLREKIGQMTQAEIRSVTPEDVQR